MKLYHGMRVHQLPSVHENGLRPGSFLTDVLDIAECFGRADASYTCRDDPAGAAVLLRVSILDSGDLQPDHALLSALHDRALHPWKATREELESGLDELTLRGLSGEVLDLVSPAVSAETLYAEYDALGREPTWWDSLRLVHSVRTTTSIPDRWIEVATYARVEWMSVSSALSRLSADD